MKSWVKYLSEVLCAGCAGIIIDTLLGLSFICTAIGLAAGIVVALIQIKNAKKEK